MMNSKVRILANLGDIILVISHAFTIRSYENCRLLSEQIHAKMEYKCQSLCGKRSYLQMSVREY